MILEGLNKKDESRHEEYVGTATKINDFIKDHNAAATTANAAASKAAQFLAKGQEIIDATCEQQRQRLFGVAPVQHTINFSMEAGRQSGITSRVSQTIHNGGRLVATASTQYNSVDSYNRRVATTTEHISARQAAKEAPLKIREPLIQLQQFVDQNNKNLQGFKVPEFQTTNPYEQHSNLFFHDFTPGIVPPRNYCQEVVEQACLFNRKNALHNLSFNSESKFNTEPPSSSWSRIAQQFKNNTDQAGETFSYTPPPPSQPAQTSLFKKALEATVDTAVTVIHGSIATNSNPAMLPSATIPAYATPVISATMPNKGVKYKKLGDELREVGPTIKKVALLSSLLTEPSVAMHVYDILTTPAHEIKVEDTTTDTKSDWYNAAWLDATASDLNHNTGVIAAKFATGVAGGSVINGAIFKASSIRHVGSFVRGAGLLGAGVMVADAFGVAAEFERDNFMYTEEYEHIINNPLISQERKDTLFDESIKRQALARKEAEHLKDLGTKFKENPTIFGLGVGSFLTMEKLPGATFASNAFMNLRIRFPFKSVANDRHIEYLNKVVKAPTGMEHIEIATGGAHGFENFSKARTMAAIRANLGEDAMPYLSKLGPHRNNVYVGTQSYDKKSLWRLDWDDIKGAHINWRFVYGPNSNEYYAGAIKIDKMSYGDYLKTIEKFPRRYQFIGKD